jgi:hypothetical protein
MKSKYILATVLLAAFVLGAAWLLSHNRGTAGSPAANTEMAAPAPLDARVEAVAAPAPIAAPPAATNVLTDEQREAAIDAETDRLQEWGMSGDPASLTNILADLTHPDKDVRDAAIEAAKQFGSTNAIPSLKAAAASASDIGEQIELLEAAQFLSLPSLNSGGPDNRTPEQKQADAQRNAERKARRETLMNKHSTTPNRKPFPGQSPPPGSNP